MPSTRVSLSTAMTPHEQDQLWVSSIFAMIVILSTASYLYASSGKTPHSSFWRGLDIVGVHRPGFLPWTRAILGSILSTTQNTMKGYERFCKARDIPFALPTIWTGRAVVVLPPSLLNVLNRPDSELAAHHAQHETIQLPYMISDRDVYDNPIQFDVVRRTLSQRQVGSLAAATAEELDRAFTAYWGQSGEETDGEQHWTTLNNWQACGKVVSRAAMRVLVGEPLCHNERLLDLATRYADAVIQGTAMINCMPPFLRPMIGPLFGLPAKYYQSRCLKILAPLIQERIRRCAEPQSGAADDMPDDFLQWMIVRCVKAGKEQVDASRIAMRLLALVTMSVMGMVWVLSHCIQDLYTSPSKNDFLEGLESECRLLVDNWPSSQAPNDTDFKDSIAGLKKLDSTLRESMRLSSISVISLARDVVADELVLGPDQNLKIPRGVRVVFPSQAMHRDPDFVSGTRPMEFNAFRYSSDAKGNQAREGPEIVPSEQSATTSTAPSESFLVWGYGRHVCPGRWYAAQTLKQALAHIIVNYDVEVLGDRNRPRKSLGNVVIPHIDVKIKVRRKRSSGN